MKKIVIQLVFILGLITPSVAQKNCNEYRCMKERIENAIKRKEYKIAFKDLEAAAGYSDSKADEIAMFRQQLFDAIEKEKDEAKHQKERADIQTIEAQREKINAELAEQKAKNALTQTIFEKNKADSLKKVAEANQEIAVIEKNIADSIRYETQKSNEIILAKQIALKARFLDKSQIKLKMALSKLAYNICKNNDKLDMPELYSGIFYTLKSLNKDGGDFNVVKTYDYYNFPIPILYISTQKNEMITTGLDNIRKKWQFNIDSNLLKPVSIIPKREMLKRGELKYSQRHSGNIYFKELPIYLKGEKDTLLWQTNEIEIKFEEKYKYFERFKDSYWLVGTDTLYLKANELFIKSVTRNYKLLDFEQKISCLKYVILENKITICIGCSNGFLFFLNLDKNYNIVNLKIEKTTHFGVISQIEYLSKIDAWAIGSFDGTVSISNMSKIFNDTYYYPLILDNHHSWVMSIAYNVDKNLLMVGCKNGSLHIWNLDMHLLYLELNKHLKEYKTIDTETLKEIKMMFQEVDQKYLKTIND